MNPTRTYALYSNSFTKVDPEVATIVFTRTDGLTVTVENALYDTAGPAGANPGCICVETTDERGIIHIPFVASWEVK